MTTTNIDPDLIPRRADPPPEERLERVKAKLRKIAEQVYAKGSGN
jgi:hypothetical protein